MTSSSVAFAGSAPLAPGKAAGVQKAESFMSERTGLWILGAGVIVGGVLLVGGGGHGSHGAVSTCAPGQTSCPGTGGGGGGGGSGTGTN